MMQNNTHSYSNNLGVFGWSLSSIADIKLTTDSDNNVYIHNSGIESILPNQQAGTALYNAPDPQTPLDELISNPYSLNKGQLIQPYSSSKRVFYKQTDGSYQGSGTLTWKTNHYELEEADGTKIVFRADGQLNYVADSNGYRLTAGYSNGVVNRLSASNGDRFTFGYNSDGRIKTVTDNKGQVDRYSYDATGQYLLSVEDSNGTTSFSYDNPFDPTVVSSVTYDDGSKVSYDYDHAGRLQQIIYGEGREALATTYSYDDNGGVTVINPDGGTNSELRNAQGQVSQSIDANGRVTNYSYDDSGNLTGISSELGYSAGFSYDDNGNVVSQTNALNQTTNFTYQADSNKLSGFKDARGNDVLYSYDNRGNLSQITYEDSTTDKYFYNDKGLLTKSVNRRGQDVTYEYNSNYQITKETHSDGRIIEYEYETNIGLLSSINVGHTDEITQIEYNQVDNELVMRYPKHLVCIHTFDELGRKSQITIQDGTNTYTTNYSYDSLGRLDRLTDGNGNLIVDYDYHPVDGQLAKETNGNGTYTSYSYDLAGQLISLVNAQADGTVNSRFDYTYDNLGRRTEVDTLDGTWSYEYDLTGQLTGAVFASTNPDIESQDLTYVYDAAGNRTQTIVNGVTENYSTNNLNQYENAGMTTYNYDLDGNLISKTKGGQTWTYSYNDDNRLVGVVDGDSNLTQYEYDAFGNRTATVYNGQRTEYLIDPFGYGDVIAEYDGDGNLIAKYEHGIGLVSRTDANNSQAFYDFDGTGSTAALTGQAGNELNSYNYRPFGEDFHEVETVNNSFEYIGQWGITEEANGLDFMRARYYDSHSGRFAASDPIGLQGNDSNFYRYVGNDPISFIDPEGTKFVTGSLVGDAIYYPTVIGGGAGYAVGRNFGETGQECLSPLSYYFSIAGGLATSVGGAAALLSLGAGITVFAAAAPVFFIAAGAFVVGGAIGNAHGCGNPVFPGYSERAEDGFEGAEQTSSPLVLDLDGDGIELTAVGTTNAFFDIDGDGFREATGWVQSDDGLLVLDRNNDGYINDNSELFGNFNTSGFVELRAIDDNGDNVIDANDSQFADLQVWRDLDTDGRSDANELYSLAELNIVSLNAVANSVDIVNEGNQIWETTVYELADGTTRELADPWFAINQLNSYYDHNSTYNEPVVITEQILQLPNLKGYGNLPDLRIAMAKDAQLQSLVQSFTDKVSSGDIAGGRDLVSSILYRWAGADSINPASRGIYVDGQKLRFLEKFIGRNWQNSSDDNLRNPRDPAPGVRAVETYNNLSTQLETRLLAQIIESPIDYNTTDDRFVFSGSTVDAIERLEEINALPESLFSETKNVEAIAVAEFIQQAGGRYQNWIVGGLDNEQLTGNDADESIYGFIGNDILEAEGGDDSLNGGLGNDSLDGGSGNDTLNGGAGNDTLRGMAGDDTYIFHKGFGHDVIEDYNLVQYYFASAKEDGGNSDTLRFGNGITRDNLRWNFDGTDLKFTLANSPNDSLTILNYINTKYRIENIEVDDNTLSIEEIFNSTTNKDTDNDNSLIWTETAIKYQGLGGDDTITTGNHEDRLWGNWGDDKLNTNAGNDTLNGGAGNDTLEGGDGNDFSLGGTGNDLLTDGNFKSGNDTLNGGVGNDTLRGMAGDDTYVFHKGYGHDLIEDYNLVQYYFASAKEDGGSNDTLRFGSGITRNNLRWNFDGKDLKFTLTNSPNDSLTILNYINAKYRLENIEVDGSTLSMEEIFSSTPNKDINNDNSLIWTETAIKYQGLGGNDTITTGNYDDKLWGNWGNDLINSGSGNDTLDGNVGNDTLEGGDGNDLSLGGTGNDLLTDGNFKLGNDTLNGGAGNDTLQGMAGDDLYLFNKGFGHDVIEDYNLVQYYFASAKEDGGSNDTLRFGNGITEGNLRWNFDGTDLKFTLANSPNDSLTILNYINAEYRLENIEVDGNTLSIEEIFNSTTNKDTDNDNSLIWTETAIKYQGLGGDDTITTGNHEDRLWGNWGNDKLTTNAGNDTLNGGAGNDTLEGGDGNDLSLGGTGNDLLTDGNFKLGNDTLNGGAGNDTLRGMAGDDTYVFHKGFGHDVIEDYNLVQYYNGAGKIDGGDNDTLRFGNGITEGNLRWNFDGIDLTFTLTDSPNDSLTILNYINTKYRIENIEVDGNTLSIEEIFNSTTNKDTDNDNSLIWTETAIKYQGLGGDDTITTGNHEDRLWGNWGDDKLNTNAGNDTLNGGAGNDTLEGGDGNDLSLGGPGNDLLTDGNFKLGNDTLNGGAGNDTLRGMAGDDTYIFHKGFGHDVIEDYNLVQYYFASAKEDGGSNDTLRFGNGITEGNLRWNFDGIDLTFTLTDSPNDSLKIINYFNAQYRIENIEVAGTQLSTEEILNLQTGQDTNDLNSLRWLETAISFQGLDGNDTITTGSGNDRLWGNDGDDIINSGDGNDLLNGGAGNDTLNGGAGNDKLFVFSNNQITLNDTQVTGDGVDTFSNIEQINLYGGGGNNKIDARNVTQLNVFIKGENGNDILRGGAKSDGIQGGNGNDTLIGGAGNDTLNGGAGYDRILATADVNFTLTDTRLRGVGTDTIYNVEVARLQGGAGNNIIDATGATKIKAIIVGDGGNDTLMGSQMSDVIYGGTGNDVLIGELGNDTLVGNGGADIFVLESASGADTIKDFQNGVDRFGLSASLGFSDLSISNNQAKTATLIVDLTNNDRLLAVVNNIDAANITSADFT